MIPVYNYSLYEVERYMQFNSQGQKKIGNQNKNQQKVSMKKKEEQKEKNLKEAISILQNQYQEKDQKLYERNLEPELDGFLTGLEFDDLKRHYDDFNFADLVISFPNPDSTEKDAEIKNQNQAVTFIEAEKCFDEVLTVMGTEGYSKSQLKTDREAFLYSFLLLKDYQGKKKVQKTQVQNKNQQNKSKKKDYQAYLDMIEEQILQFQIENNSKVTQDDINSIIYSEQNLKQLIKIKLSDSSQFVDVKKCYSQGGFLEKRIYNQDQKDFDWVCKNDPPRDFLTLIRNYITIKLTKRSNLHCRQFLSSTGKEIFMIIKSNEQVLKEEAKNSNLTKQLELGYADLFSLEPCDKFFRPLRLKNEVRNAVKQVKEQLQGNLDYNKGINDKFEITDEDMNIEEEAKKVYLNIKKWDKNERWINIAKKQMEVDKWLEELSQDLKIDTSFEKTTIINDYKHTTDQEWNAYFIYLCYLCYFSKKVKQLLHIGNQDIKEQQLRGGKTNIIEMNKGFLYKLIFRKALGDANQIHKQTHGQFASSQILKTLWNRLGMDGPISPYTDYFQTVNNDKEDTIWRQYEVNEKGYRSIFLNMEKIKITNQIIQKQINISKLVQQGYLVKYNPIHDQYQLKGENKQPFFQSLYQNNMMIEKETTQSEILLKQMFALMKDEAESTDFDSESLLQETQFDKYKPWNLSIDSIRDYFGEKIAIYFNFLIFYLYHLSYMSGIALAMQIIQGVGSYRFVEAANIFFSILIIVWSTMFIEFWKREQVIFSLKYGQQDFEEDEAERPSFKGNYIRNITNDDMNEKYYSPTKRKLIMLISVLVSVSIIGLVVACVFLIFTFKSYLIDKNYPFLQNIVINSNTVPAALNAVQIGVVNIIYEIIAEKLNSWENHKILSSYENSYIAKIFLFQFFNLFNSCIFIAYLSPLFENLKLCEYDSGKENCFTQLSLQIGVIFLANFLKNFVEIGKPLIMKWVKKYTNKSLIDQKPVQHPFMKIDSYIEKQSMLEPYQKNSNIDGTIEDYMELAIQFSFLALFGVSFPSSFILAFLNNIAEVQVDKYKMINLIRRPMPSGASNIGTWLLILDVITFCSIFSNAGLIAYTSQPIVRGNFRLINMGDDYVQDETDQRIIVFSTLLIVFLAVKYLLRFIIPDVPQKAVVLNKRHKITIDTVVRGFQKSEQKIYKTAKLNFNIGGIIYSHFPDQQSNNQQQQQQ